MDFERQLDIEKELLEISEFATSVSIVINNTTICNDCRLIYKPDNGKELFIQVASSIYFETGDVELTCALPGGLYTFKSRIIPQKEIDSQDRNYFKIQMPNKITKGERRQYFRVQPSETNPIQIRLAMPDSDAIDVEAMDVGGGGISFAVLKSLNYLNVGDQLYLDINLPTCNWLSALAEVKNITALQNTVRIGVGFSRISKDTYKIIMEYITSSITEKESGNG
jgi:c-di-GMP-binding flagellar brake protein YcgR